MTTQALLETHGGWLLTPEGAAIHPRERTAVIADVHLGYEWARGHGGDCLPAHSLAETMEKLGRLLGRVSIERLVVAGDLVESRRWCGKTERDVNVLMKWLEACGVLLIPLAGNHDPPRRLEPLATLEVAGWTIAHGHLEVAAARTISGHLHPVLRTSEVSVPCFLLGADAIVLPAFSPNAAGVSLAALGIPRASFRCIAAAGDELLDFGPVPALLAAL